MQRHGSKRQNTSRQRPHSRRRDDPNNKRPRKESGHVRRASVHPGRSRPPRHAGAPLGGGARRSSWPPGHVVRAGGGPARRRLCPAHRRRKPARSDPGGPARDADGRAREHQVSAGYDRRGRRHAAQGLARGHRPRSARRRPSAPRRHRPAGSGGPRPSFRSA